MKASIDGSLDQSCMRAAEMSRACANGACLPPFPEPLLDPVTRPCGFAILVAKVARIGRAIREGSRRRWRTHRMIATPHIRIPGSGHVAGDAAAACRSAGVMRVGRDVLHTLLVAGQTGVVRLIRSGKPITAARRMAMQAVELSAVRAGTHQPTGVSVVLPAVAAIGIKIIVFERHQVVVIEEAVAGRKVPSSGVSLA